MCWFLRSFLCNRGCGRPPPWSSGQNSWLQIQRSEFDSRRYHNFLRSSESGTGFAQPRECNRGASLEKCSGSGLGNLYYGRMAIRRADYASPLFPQKLTQTSPTSGGHSVGIVRSRNYDDDDYYYLLCIYYVAISRWIRQRNSIKFCENLEKLLPSS
jgi:hypothetical protein